MAAARDGEGQTVVDFGAHVIALDREQGERGGDVDDGQRIGRPLERDAARRYRGGEPLENLKLERQRAVGGVGDFRFKLAELGGRKSHLACERLPMNEGGVERHGEHFLAMLGGNVDEIAEHIVVPDFQRADTRHLGIANLQRRDDAARFVAQCAGFVEGRLITCPHKAPVTPRGRQLVGQGPTKLSGERAIGLAQRLGGAGEVPRPLRERRYPLGKCCRCENSVANGGKVARPAAADDDTGQCARQIWRCFQPLAQLRANDPIVDQDRDRIEAMADLARVGQRRGKPLCQKPRARRRHRAIDSGKQRTPPLAADRSHQFEIAARRLVDRKRRSRRLADRR